MIKNQKQEIKRLEKIFLDRSQKYLSTIIQSLDHQFKEAIKACPNTKCLKNLQQGYSNYENSTIKYFTYLSKQLQICMEKEVKYSGIDGYKKCFAQFEILLKMQQKNRAINKQ